MTDTLPNVLRYPTNIEHMATDALVPYARNSRTHSPEQVAQIAASIREYGFTNPVLIDANNILIAGHGRVMAAQHLGLPTVPAIRLAHLTDAQRRAYVIADNKLAENAGWDMATLAREIEDLIEFDYDLSLLGFDPETLEDILPEHFPATDKPAQDKPTFNYVEKFSILVSCKDEANQAQVFDTLQGQGYDCKVLVN